MLLVLENADLHAPDAVGRRHLVIAGERLAAVSETKPEIAGIPVEVVDLDGRRVVPGLIDAHVHLTGGGGEAGPASKVPPLAPSRFTTAGITSVVGLLGTDDLTRSPAEVLVAARGLRERGLSAWMWTGGYRLPPATITGSVRSDIVLVEQCIGCGEVALSDHRSSQPTLDEVLRLAADCHVGGLMSGKAGVLHLHLGDGDRGLELVRRALAETELPARVFHPTHVNRRRALFEEAAELAQDSDLVVDVTAFPEELVEGDEVTAAAALEDLLSRGPAVHPRVTVSSDGGGCLPRFDAEGRVADWEVGDPGELTRTLARLVAGGVPLATALLPFTRSVAQHLRLPRKGGLVPGWDADLLVLDDACRPVSVMARGRWHVLEGRRLVEDPFGDAPRGERS